MTSRLQTALDTLRAHEPELRAKGIMRAAIFGSAARGEDRDGSDIDILIDISPHQAKGLFGLTGLMNEVKDLFDGHVDVVSLDGLRPRFLKRIEPDLIYAF